MKKISLHIINYTLIIAILFAGSGLFLNKMECLMSGNTYISFKSFDDCSDVTKTCEITEKCCDFGQLLLKMKYDGFVQQSQYVVQLPISYQPFEIINADLIPIDKNFTVYTDLPPPLTTTDRLATLQVFRI